MRSYSLLLTGGAAALLLIGAGCGAATTTNQVTGGSNTVTATSTDGTDEMAISADIEPSVEIVTTATGTMLSVTKSYKDSLDIYGKSGARFEFSKCSGTPGTLNIKRNGKFMIDNRDGIGHTIAIAGKSYYLGAYGFAIVSVQKSGSYNITCDGGGSAHVGVQN